MFTYFYNKFRPVNHMHYIKYGVNSSLLTLDHNSQRGWFTNLLWCDILQNKAPHTGPHHIWHIYTLCCSYGHGKDTDGSRVWLMISLASACYGDSQVAKHLLCLNLVFQPIWGVGRSWLFPASSIKFLTRRSLKSWWVYLAPHEDNSIHTVFILWCGKVFLQGI